MFVWLCLIVGASATGRFLTAGQVMTGEPLDVPVNSSRVLTAAQFAVVEFNKANAEEQFAYKVMKITSAKMQIVAGVNYILEVQLGRTVCKKSDGAVSETYALHPEPKCTMGIGDKKRWVREQERGHTTTIPVFVGVKG